MSIASAITSAQQKVAAAYTAISNKGGTLPATQDLANMPTAINSISTSSGGLLEGIIEDIVDGNNPVDVTALQSAETQINAFLGSSS